MLTLCQEDQSVDMVEVLNQGIEQLREEHVVLRAKLTDFYKLAKSIGANREIADWSGVIADLRSRIIVFMEALDSHSEWEDQVLFPMVGEYTGKDIGPISVLEREHELAKQNVGRFLEATSGWKRSTPFNQADAADAASFLLQTYVILNEHFKKEEEVLFPLAEQMLADFEQFFAS